MAKPITPEDAEKQRILAIPDFVIEAMNELLVQKLHDNHATIYIEEIIEKALERAPFGVTREDLFKQRMLDIENTYRNAGWKVVFDKPGFNESYEANFKFTK
jgi:uncharacterized membrane-anchored protein